MTNKTKKQNIQTITLKIEGPPGSEKTTFMQRLKNGEDLRITSCKFDLVKHTVTLSHKL